MLTPITLRGSSPTSRTGPTTCGIGSAKNAYAPPPSAAADSQASGPWPSLLLPVGERWAHSRVPPSPLGRVVRNSLYPRTNAASWLFPSGGASPRSDPGSAPTISRHAARLPLPPHPAKNSLPLPFQKILVDGPRAPVFLRQGLPLATRAQHVHDPRKHLLRVHRFASSSRPPLVFPDFLPLPLRHHWRHLLPPRVRHLP